MLIIRQEYRKEIKFIFLIQDGSETSILFNFRSFIVGFINWINQNFNRKCVFTFRNLWIFLGDGHKNKRFWVIT